MANYKWVPGFVSPLFFVELSFHPIYNWIQGSTFKWDVVLIVSFISRWWFQIFFIFIPIWGRFLFWLIFFRWVETTNQICFKGNKHVILLGIFTERKKGCRLSELDAEVGANKQQLEIPLDVVADIPTKVDSSVSWMPARGGSFSFLRDPIWDQWIIYGFPMGFCKMRLLK